MSEINTSTDNLRSNPYEIYDDEPLYEPDEERDLPETFGCMFPDKCCMPGPHYPSECHTAEMLDGEA